MMGKVLSLYCSIEHLKGSEKILAFGQKIWQFRDNVSAMKQLAAQDFEDILQVRVISVANSMNEPC